MTKESRRTALSRSLRIAMVLGLGLLFGASALAKKEELPEVSKDGLHLLKDTKVAVAYAKPGASLDGYTKVKILDCFVAFKQNWQRDYNMNEIGLEGRVTDKDAEQIKKNLAEEFNKVFADELTKNGYPVVDDVGSDVLLLRPALINVDVYAPDTNRGWGHTLVKSAGEMTLYMELYDSATSTLLARVIDPQADDSAFAKQANRVTNRAAADRILRHWADMLAKHLGEVQGK
ncbi:MAG: DUF3313 family protein [Xanthomonadales bacterium]|nr:DUF3313 family protein [Xanthomonadales bacterium]